MKMDEIKQLSVQELKKRLSDEEDNLANMRFQLATSQLESPIKVRTVRRDIARIKTLLREREAAEAKTATPAPPKPQATESANTEVKQS